MALVNGVRIRIDHSTRWLAWLTATLLAFSALAAKPRKAYDPDLNLAQAAAILGHNRLAQDATDSFGLKLVRLVLTLDPENERALLTLGLLEREAKLQPVEAKVTEEKFLDAVLARGLGLLDKDLPGNEKLGPLCLLYLRTVELSRPADEKLIVGLLKLRRHGQEQAFDDLVARPLGLEAIFAADAAKPAAPAPRRTKLYEADLALAGQAAALGHNRLAADENDMNGKRLVRVALALDPDNEQALLTIGLRERNLKLKPVEAPVAEEKFLDTTLARGLELLDKELPRNEKLGPLCLLHLRTVEAFRPTDPKLVVALMKLRGKGLTAELKELVATPLVLDDIFLASAAAAPAPPAAPEPGVAPDGRLLPIYPDKKPPAEPAPAEPPSKPDPKPAKPVTKGPKPPVATAHAADTPVPPAAPPRPASAPGAATYTLTRAGVAVAGASVSAFDVYGNYLTYTKTDDNGLARFSIAAGTRVKFRYDDMGTTYWTQPAQAPTDVAVDLPEPTIVTVTRNHVPVADVKVAAFDAKDNYITYQSSDENGVVRFSIAAGTRVKFRLAEEDNNTSTDVVTTPGKAVLNLPR